jgi:hypothetical protein
MGAGFVACGDTVVRHARPAREPSQTRRSTATLTAID